MEIEIIKYDRKILVERVDISLSAKGFLEGSPEGIRKFISLRIKDNVIETYGNFRPIQIITSDNFDIDGFRVFLDLKSRSPVKAMLPTLKKFDYSLLGIVFFVSKIDFNLDKILLMATNHLEWDKYALNCSWDDL